MVPSASSEANISDLKTQFRSLLSEFEYWVDDEWVQVRDV